ncbi:hypothetical protein AAY473_004490 [Plecturocebus cupreus]
MSFPRESGASPTRPPFSPGAQPAPPTPDAPRRREPRSLGPEEEALQGDGASNECCRERPAEGLEMKVKRSGATWTELPRRRRREQDAAAHPREAQPGGGECLARPEPRGAEAGATASGADRARRFGDAGLAGPGRRSPDILCPALSRPGPRAGPSGNYRAAGGTCAGETWPPLQPPGAVLEFSWGLSGVRSFWGHRMLCRPPPPPPPAGESLAGPTFLLCSPWLLSTRSWRGRGEGRGARPPDGPPLSAAAATRARGSGACSWAHGKGAAGKGGAVWACWAGGRFRSQDQFLGSEACGRPVAVQGVSARWLRMSVLAPEGGEPHGAGGRGAADPGLISPPCPQRAWGLTPGLLPPPFPSFLLKTVSDLGVYKAPALWEAEVGGSPEVRSFKTSLANMVKTHLY